MILLRAKEQLVLALFSFRLSRFKSLWNFMTLDVIQLSNCGISKIVKIHASFVHTPTSGKNNNNSNNILPKCDQ